MPSSSVSRLFQPIRVGVSQLQHRVVHSPMTRYRANAQHEHGELAVEYYTQRASVSGTLLITEATFIAPQAAGYASAPGIWSEAQITAWKKVVDAVHAKGSYIFLQLWALGRTAKPAVLEAEGQVLVGAGDIPLDGRPVPRPLTVAEIKDYVQLYATAASNAVHKAGFDGVEIHGANGYLVDQFLQSVSNNRTDGYGGSVENRTRFAFEVIDTVVAAVGADKTGLRLSPWSTFQNMGMPDPIPTFTHLVTRLRDTHPDFAYIHVIDIVDREGDADPGKKLKRESHQVLRDIWGSKPYIAAEGFDRESAIETVDKKGGLVAFGKNFLSNPDLPVRLRNDLELNPWNGATFYTPGAIGYTDYPFARL